MLTLEHVNRSVKACMKGEERVLVLESSLVFSTYTLITLSFVHRGVEFGR